MKIAILHEMLVKLWWAEKVVEAFMQAFPEAKIFTLIYDEKKVGQIFPKNKIDPQVFSLKSQKIYNLFKNQRFCLKYMPLSVEQLDFSWYDIVLASSSWFAHWAITKPETKFIVYYHSPAWYMWHQTHNYQRMILQNKNFLIKFFLKYYLLKTLNKLRIWDFIASQRNNIRIVASKSAKQRLKKYYKKDSIILYPPVEIDKFYNNFQKQDYFVSIWMLTESKNFEFLIKIFNDFPEKKLKIIWDWHLKNYLQKLIKSKNIELLWYKSWKDLYNLVAKAKWAILAWVEDFWIAWIEALAWNTPVLALNAWWYKETIIPWITGELFELKKEDFKKKLTLFEKNIDNNIYKKENLIKQAQKFSKKNFIKKIKEIVLN